jgi:ferritin-like metal-binding protein YciE
MTIRTMHDLFVHTLKDIFYVEKKLAAELPGMAKKANNPELRRAFEDHASQTEAHISRLEEIFDMIELQPRGEKCPALDGLLEETEDLLKDVKDPDVRDAGLLAAARRWSIMRSPATAPSLHGADSSASAMRSPYSRKPLRRRRRPTSF